MKTRLLLLTPLVALGAILVLAQQRPAAGAKLDLSEAAKEIQFPRKGWTDQTPAEGTKFGQKGFQQIPQKGFQQRPAEPRSATEEVDLQPILDALATQAEYMKGLRARIETLEQRVTELEQRSTPNTH